MTADRTKQIMNQMMNIIMYLRKVCNYPDLFEGREIRSPFTMKGLSCYVPSSISNNPLANKGNYKIFLLS